MKKYHSPLCRVEKKSLAEGGALCHTRCVSCVCVATFSRPPQTPRAQRSPVARLKYGSLLHDFVFEFVHDRAGAPAVRLYDLCVCALQAATYKTRITVHRDCPFNTVGVASNCSDSPGGWPRAGARVLHIRARAPPPAGGAPSPGHRSPPPSGLGSSLASLAWGWVLLCFAVGCVRSVGAGSTRGASGS